MALCPSPEYARKFFSLIPPFEQNWKRHLISTWKARNSCKFKSLSRKNRSILVILIHNADTVQKSNEVMGTCGSRTLNENLSCPKAVCVKQDKTRKLTYRIICQQTIAIIRRRDNVFLSQGNEVTSE